jgi:hypothetical protein
MPTNANQRERKDNSDDDDLHEGEESTVLGGGGGGGEEKEEGILLLVIECKEMCGLRSACVIMDRVEAHRSSLNFWVGKCAAFPANGFEKKIFNTSSPSKLRTHVTVEK